MNLERAYLGCNREHASILIAHQPKAAKVAIDSHFDIDLVLSGLFYSKSFIHLYVSLYIYMYL